MQLPTDCFYNTGITTYIWLLSKNKREERKGKIQLIDASNIFHKLRKSLGNKKNEFLPEDRKQITELYASFKENEYCQIYDNTEFIYREYAIMQPLQRSYSITDESIDNMIQTGTLSKLYDESKVLELQDKGVAITEKEQKTLDTFIKNRPIYSSILQKLRDNVSNEKYLSLDAFMPIIENVLSGIDSKLIIKVADGLSVMDKTAEVQVEKKGKKKGQIIYDKATKDSEIVKWDEDIVNYMEREVLPYLPDAKWFWEEDLTKKKPVIKTGAEIPFTRYFYKYQAPTSSDELAKKFVELEESVNERIAKLFGGM